jgi:hypothetical protein
MLFFGENGVGFNGVFVSDPFARFMKMLTLIGSIVTLVMSVGFAKAEKFDKFEFPVLILLSTLGMLLMVSANDMITLYMGLELQSLAAYVIAAINRDIPSVRRKPASNISSSAPCRRACCSTGSASSTATPATPASTRSRRRSPAASGSSASIFGLVFVAAGLSLSRSRPCRSICGRRTSTRAPRPQSPPSSRLGAQDGGDGADRAHLRRRFPGRARMTGSRSSSSWRSPRWRSAPSPRSARRNIKRLLAYSSIAPHGLRARRPRRRYAGRRPRRR